VLDESTNLAIGIHTHGGCSSTGGANSGTAIHNSGVQTALVNPQGVCVPAALLAFIYPDGIPQNLNPAGDSIRVELSAGNGGTPQPGTGQLHYDAGGGFVTINMNQVSSNVYDAIFRATPCQTNVKFYFSAQTTRAQVVNDPQFAPSTTYSALSAVGIVTTFADNFESDTGWTVTNSAGLTTGMWERGVPVGGGDRRDPPNDADGSGQCYVTQNVDGNFDVDGGSTTLTSPVMDASAVNSHIAYDRWFSTNDTSGTDTILVQVSDNGGAAWTTLENYSGTVDGWFHKQWRVADIPGIAPNNQFRIRFTASDVGAGSITEGGVDGVNLFAVQCDPPPVCPADINADEVVNVDDLLAVINTWGACAGCAADFVPPGGDGQVNVDDLLGVINAWGPCP
jgi:hypothetical protein